MRKKSLKQIDAENMKRLYRNYKTPFPAKKTDPAVLAICDHNFALSEKFKKIGKASHHQCYKKQKRVGPIHGAVYGTSDRWKGGEKKWLALKKVDVRREQKTNPNNSKNIPRRLNMKIP